jgi:hypothetical protein
MTTFLSNYPKANLVLGLFLLLGCEAKAQTVTYAEHIAPLIYTHCTSCHRDGEIGRFPLTNYQEVMSWATVIRQVTQVRYMPPWQPDPTYSRFVGENVLTDTEIQQIADWVAGGMPRGDMALEPTPPTFPTGSQVGVPDLTLSFAEMLHHPAGGDDYRVVVLPTGLTQDRDIKAIEMRPGNGNIVHHVLFSWDTTGTARQNDANTPEYGYTNFSGFGVPNTDARQFPSYAPGQKSRSFPDGMGQRLPANADLLMQIHYAPTNVDAFDSSSVNLFFTPTPATRQVQQYVMLPNSLTNGPFIIPANQEVTFHGQFTVPFNATLLNVGPHMHMLGKSWEVFAIKPNGDTVNLIKLNKWDFHWQGNYSFPRLIRISPGTVIHAYATYDNTSNNPHNPNNPITDVTWGESTTEEMFYLSFFFTSYQVGDENIVIPEDTLQLGPPLISALHQFEMPKNKLYPPYPNPTQNGLDIAFKLVSAPTVMRFEVVDAFGRVAHFSEAYYHQGDQLHHLDLPKLANGIYFLRLRGEGFDETRSFFIQH